MCTIHIRIVWKLSNVKKKKKKMKLLNQTLTNIKKLVSLVLVCKYNVTAIVIQCCFTMMLQTLFLMQDRRANILQMMSRDYTELRFNIKKYKYRKLTDMDLDASI